MIKALRALPEGIIDVATLPTYDQGLIDNYWHPFAMWHNGAYPNNPPFPPNLNGHNVNVSALRDLYRLLGNLDAQMYNYFANGQVVSWQFASFLAGLEQEFAQLNQDIFNAPVR